MIINKERKILMKKIIAAALSILVAACGYTMVDKATDDRLVTLEKQASSYQADISDLQERVSKLESLTTTAPDILAYNKNQIVAYYNTCLQSSYAQTKMTDVKTEKVTIDVDSVTINGRENGTVTNMANSIANNNQKQIEDSKSFSIGISSDGTAASTFVLPANLSSAGVKSASISKSGSEYKVVITLISESCGHNTKPPYNASCAWPLDINEVDGALNGFAKITKAQFVYPGTMLTANIDAAGRVSYVRVDMPLTVKDGTGVVTKNIPGVKGMVITASAHGQWTCTHTMSF